MHTSLLAPLIPFLLSRALILVVYCFVAQSSLIPVPGRYGSSFLIESDWNFFQLQSGLRAIFDSADAGWYRQLAETGYDALSYENNRAHNWVLFPLFPLLLGLLLQLGVEATTAGVILSSLCFYFALVTLHHYFIALGKSTVFASRSIWFVSFFPTSYFFLSPITESLFFLLLVGTFSSLHFNRVILAGSLMALAGACRPTGLLLLPAFALALLSRSELSRSRQLFALALAPIGVLLFATYLYFLTGNPFAFIDNQSSWGRSEQSFWDLAADLVLVRQSLVLPWNFVLLNLAAVILALASSMTLAKRRNWSFIAIVILPVVAGLATGTLQSLARHISVLFPIYLSLGEWTEDQRMERMWLVVMTFLLAIMTLGFALRVTAAMA